MKNVLIGIPCLLTGGTEIQTLNLIKALIAGGHRVTTVCYFEFSPQMVQTYREAGSEVICLNPAGKRVSGRKGILFLYKGLRRVVKQLQPDVVHVQYMAPGAIPILILKLLGVKQILATSHTMADIYPDLRLVHFIQKHCVRAFTCITRRAEDSFFGNSRLYTPSLQLHKRNHFTIYNSLPSYIAIRSDKRQHTLPITIGVVSRLERIKGMDMVIPALAKVRQQFPDVKLLIVGDGSLRNEMQEQASELQINDIEWAGRQPQHALQDLYDRIDILLMPSRSEGFGLTAIEAMARGCCVVAANTGGLPEVVQDRKTGLLHEPQSMDDMAAKTCELVGDPTLRDAISSNSTQQTQYSFECYSALLNDLYAKLM